MSARDDYPRLMKSVSGTLHLTDELDATRSEGQDALDEIDRLRWEVEHLGKRVEYLGERVETLTAERDALIARRDEIMRLSGLTVEALTHRECLCRIGYSGRGTYRQNNPDCPIHNPSSASSSLPTDRLGGGGDAHDPPGS